MENERKELVETIKQMFDRDSNRNIFQKYIEYIRFPFFKNFEENLKVNFTFPITFIVGQNGSGKSSLLHALYGAPKGKSVSEFWYTTDLDPIKDIATNRNCLIYSFKTEITKTRVEVLKQRSGTKKGKDYWEPAEPKMKYGMSKLPSNANSEEASKDRWNPIDKKVILMDFRYSLSAYDKYFYFGSKPNTDKIKSKQDLIRKYAPKLRSSFDENKKISYYSRKVYDIKELSNNEKIEIEKILGKQYIETKFLEHNFYDRNKGFAIRYKTKNTTYSEAYAGSGETAIVKLVIDLLNAEDYSLILLDEPETSLHPLAQKRLINFILEQIKKRKLQVIISTHSPDIIEGMPKEAIKIFYENPESGKVNIIENVYPENAFVHIGRTISDKKVIIVEDILAKMIVEKIINENGDSELFEVKYFPNGESIIKKEFMLVYSKEESNNHFIIFDGDQKADKIKIEELPDVEKTIEILEEKIKSITKGKDEEDGQNIQFAVDGGKDGGNEEQKIDLMLKYLKFHHDNVFFLPRNIPEEIIWNDSVLDEINEEEVKEQIFNESNFKEKIRLLAKWEYDSDTNEDITAIHKKLIKIWVNKKNEDYEKVNDIITQIKEK